MIVITAELWPHGDRARRETLGICTIVNDGTGTLTSGNYKVGFSKRGGKGLFKNTRVDGFPRKRLLVWDLLYRALDNIVGSRNSSTCYRCGPEPTAADVATRWNSA